MSQYGKDPESLYKVVPFGGGSYQQKMSYGTRRPKRTQSSRRRFNEEFQPDETEHRWGRLIPGKYSTFLPGDEAGVVLQMETPYVRFVEHFHGGLQRGTICSGGPLHMSQQYRQPCHGCDIFWEHYDLKKANPNAKMPMSMRDMWALNWLDYGKWHKIPQYDPSTGQPKMNPKTDKPYTQWVRHSQETEQLALETKIGHLQPWPMGYRYYTYLEKYGDHLSSKCGACGGDNLVTTSWNCASCAQIVMNPNTTNLNQEQQNELVANPLVCPHCQNQVMLVETIKCMDGCADPRRTSIFDASMLVARQKAEGKVGTQLMIFESRIEPIPQELKEIAKPLPLDKMYAADSLERQAELYKLPVNRPAPQPQAGQAVSQPGLPPRQPVPQEQPATPPPQQPMQPQAPAQGRPPFSPYKV